MSEENRDPDGGNTDAVKVSADDTTGGGVSVSGPEKPQRKTRRGEPLAWVALFLILAAIGGSLFLWQQFQTRTRAAQQQMAVLDSGMRSLTSQLESLKAQAADRAQLQSVAKQAERTSTALANRVTALESELGEMRNMGARDRHAWLAAETAHLLRLADDEVRLARNPAAAMAALEAADARLKTLADPRMTPVRAQIAEALARLHAIAIPDIAGLTLKLDALGKQVPVLPLAHRTGRDYAAATTPAGKLQGKPSWWQRFKDEVATAFRTMVTIRRDNPHAKPLLAPEAEEYLRLNLQLRLDAARVALLQHDQATFRANIDAVTNWLGTYFAADDPAVRGAQTELAALAQAHIAMTLPDVSTPLATFEKVRAGEAATR